MTKVTIIGEATPEQQKKPIEFVKYVDETISAPIIEDSECLTPSDYKHIELICKSSTDKNYDIMFAYDTKRSEGSLYLGHFNDGIV